jgi:hypothetical protein
MRLHGWLFSFVCTFLVVGLAGVGSGCGQNAHVLGPGPATPGAMGTDPSVTPPGGRTDTPSGNGGPTTSNPDGTNYPNGPGFPIPPIKPGSDKGGQNCPAPFRAYTFESREMSVGERAGLTSGESGFAMEITLPAHELLRELHGAQLRIVRDTVPARGQAGASVCLMTGSATHPLSEVCANVEDRDLPRLNLLELFPAEELADRFYQGSTLRWIVPSSWHMSRAVLQLEMIGNGCDL